MFGRLKPLFRVSFVSPADTAAAAGTWKYSFSGIVIPEECYGLLTVDLCARTHTSKGQRHQRVQG